MYFTLGGTGPILVVVSGCFRKEASHIDNLCYSYALLQAQATVVLNGLSFAGTMSCI